MKVIKMGIIPEITCDCCNSVLQYDKQDINEGKYIICPVCEKHITINAINQDTPIKCTAFDKLVSEIAKLNDGWKPDFTNENQKKYYPYFEYDDNGEFVFDNCPYDCWGMDVPSALYLKSEELALYAKDVFFDLYKEYYTYMLNN